MVISIATRVDGYIRCDGHCQVVHDSLDSGTYLCPPTQSTVLNSQVKAWNRVIAVIIDPEAPSRNV